MTYPPKHVQGQNTIHPMPRGT